MGEDDEMKDERIERQKELALAMLYSGQLHQNFVDFAKDFEVGASTPSKANVAYLLESARQVVAALERLVAA